MNDVEKRSPRIVVAVLISIVGHVPLGPSADHNLIAIAAATENGGGQGIRSRPQQNATVSGSAKANSSVNGSQIRGKR